MTPVRVRFAPSPTGYLHVGGARTVLFNWLYARHMGGTFVLRIEDTDQERSTPEAERMQIEDIKWLGLLYDEGPDLGGPFPPYRQSERKPLYQKYAQELMDRGLAYHCFCSDEVLDQKRQAALSLGTVPQYDGTCRKLSSQEVQSRLAQGEKALVRFKAPIRVYRLQDIVRGEVVFPENMVGDFVVLRSDGMPVYNFCCVIDDHLMEISHVIRAEEHLSNTVRQMMLYEAFGWTLPQFAHCSLILGADRAKLSKRHGDTSVHQYAAEGYLAEALVNFLALLGWSPEGDAEGKIKEVMTLEELVQKYSLERLNKAPSVFDLQKLRWMNGEYIRHMPLDEIFSRAVPFLKKMKFYSPQLDSSENQTWLKSCFDLIRGHLHTLSEVETHMGLFFDEGFSWDPEALNVARESKPLLEMLRQKLEAHSVERLSAEQFLQLQDDIKKESGAKGKGLFMPLRVGLTGQVHGPELKLVVPLLSRASLLMRVQKVLQAC